MRIGLVRRGYSGSGGAEAYLTRFAAALLAAGHECVLFTSTDWPQKAWPADRFEYLRAKSPIEFANALEQVKASVNCDLVFSLERVWECDCFRAGDGIHRAWLQRRKLIEPFWKGWIRTVFNRKHHELLTLESHLFSKRGAGIVIANSLMVKQEIIQYHHYPAERIHVVYNGVPSCAAPPELRLQTRRQLGLSEFDYVVLFAGSGWERKGLKFAIEGIKRANLSRPLLLVAGRGNPKKYSASRRVRFLGPIKDMRPYYAAADVFILPTVYDPFSNACLEALSAGLPVITTTANGFSEIVKPGMEGEVLDDPSDSEALARAIEAWSDPERRACIKPQLLDLAAQFSVEANVRATLEVIQAEK
ncbi:MAG: glycosyltransferase family 4 protein [Verrucomicrobiota bacterium]